MASPQLSVHRTLGAVFIGFAFSCVVYGVLIDQVFRYFRQYPLDRKIFKITVIVITLLETADQAFMGHMIYYYAISNYAQPLVLLEATMTWSLILQLAVGALVGVIVKVYLGFRVWRFSARNFYVTGLILSLTLGQLGLAIAYSIRAFQLPSIFSVHRLQVIGTISLGTGVLTDIVTAGALCFFLNRLRTGYQRSDSLVDMLCAYAVNTGALTSAVSVTTLLLYNVGTKDNLYFIATYFILSKFYAISLIATLNTRRKCRGRGTDQQGGVTTNNTNMFHLGTRMPSMGPNDFDQLAKVTPDNSCSRGTSVLRDEPQDSPNDEFYFDPAEFNAEHQKMPFGQV